MRRRRGRAGIECLAWRALIVIAAALGSIMSGCGSLRPAARAPTTTRWQLTASPCDGVEALITPATTELTLPPTEPPPGDSTTTSTPSISAFRELGVLVAQLARSDTFAGVAVDGQTVLVRAKDGVLPPELAHLAGVLTFNVGTARFSAKEQECIKLRFGALHDPVCEAVANRIAALGYEPNSDRMVVALKPLVPDTSADDVAALLGVDASAFHVEPYRTEMEPGTYPPFCPPCSSIVVDTTPTTARPDGASPAPVVTAPCSTSAKAAKVTPGGATPITRPPTVITTTSTISPTTSPTGGR